MARSLKSRGDVCRERVVPRQAHLRATAAEAKATEQEERIQELSQEVAETREQIRKLESTGPGDGDDSPEESSSDGSDDGGDGSHHPDKQAGKPGPLGEDWEVILNVNVYSSGTLDSTLAQPLLLLVQEHTLSAAEQERCPSTLHAAVCA